MKAIILAAGRGSRMNDISLEKPKCLVEIFGQTLLNFQLSAMRKSGIDDIAIVTGYKREMLGNFGLHEFHNANWEKSNMVTSLACASDWLQNYECIVSYSDIFYDEEIIKDLLSASGRLNVAFDPLWLELWEKRFADPLDDAETFRLDEQNLIIEIGGKASNVMEIEGQYMGLLKISPQAWAEAQKIRSKLNKKIRNEIHMTDLLQRIIDTGKIKVNAIKCNGKWGEVDTADDLQLYNK
ncbi:phosphocholine cytidylyltransferase family protein [Alphaproteobacteria bacterium]|jgi:L-glutamine-phosphate cytidylyltransferase|nr:phosphocholine cytidylyltransferase family protein [Alphaproteobacteria bacterium]